MHRIRYSYIHITIRDLSIGLSVFARAEGCETDCRADDNGEDFFIQTQTARNISMGYSAVDSRTHAVNSMTRLRPFREAMNTRSRESELNRLDGFVDYVLKLDPLDGEHHLYNEEFGEYLPDMIHNYQRHLIKEGRLHEFDPAEADAILDMDRKLGRGEVKSAAYAVSDASGAVRYVNQFVVMGDGRFQAQYMDIGKFVRDLAPSEARDIVRVLGDKYGFTLQTNNLGYTYLFSQDAALTARQIHEAVLHKLIDADGAAAIERGLTKWEQRQTEHEKAFEKKHFITDTIHAVRETVEVAGINTLRDIHQTIAPIGILLAAEFHRKFIKREGDNGGTRNTKTKGENVPAPIQSTRELPKKDPAKKSDTEILRKKTSKTRDTVVVVYEKKQYKKRNRHPESRVLQAALLLPFAGEFGLAVPVLAALDQSERKQKRKISKRYLKSAKIIRKQHIYNRETQKQSERKPKRKKRFNSRPAGEKILFPARRNDVHLQKEKKVSKGKRLRISRIFLHESREFRMKKKTMLRGERASRNNTIMKLFIAARRHMQTLNILDTDKMMKPVKEAHIKDVKHEVRRLRLKPHTRNSERKQRKREGVHMSLAWILWLLLAYERSISNPKLSFGFTEKAVAAFKKSSLEHHRMRAITSPWILLAIIWHLAMIREQGVRQGGTVRDSRFKKYAKKRKKILSAPTATPWLPVAGVIYTSHP